MVVLLGYREPGACAVADSVCTANQPLPVANYAGDSSAETAAGRYVMDKRRPMPIYAENFCASLAAYMRDVLPITRPTSR
jgi:hypothetical protein